MKFNVREVEFDFDDDYANGFKLTFEEEITAASGWCIKSIDYDIQLK